MKKKNIINEDLIVDAVCEYFKKNNSQVFTEVQLFEKFIDIYCKNTNNNYIAIEAKVNSPTRAFQQACKYKYIADFVYVAILKNNSNKTAIRLAEETGIGLMLIEKNENCGFNLTIEKNPNQSDIYIEKLANHIWQTKINGMSISYEKTIHS